MENINSKEEAIAYIEKYSNVAKRFSDLPDKYKEDKDIALIAVRSLRGGKQVFEKLLTEKTKNDLEIVSAYLVNTANPNFKLIPKEQLDKIKNSEEIKEKLSTDKEIAVACIKYGFENIPKEMWGNLNFIENIFDNKIEDNKGDYDETIKSEIFKKIISNDNVDNLEELIEIYKIIDREYTISEDDYRKIFKNNGLCDNPEFLLGFSEYKVNDNNTLEEMKGYLSMGHREKRELRRKANEIYGVCQFASLKLINTNPRFLSEAINRGISGLDVFDRYDFLKNQDFLMDVACGIDLENENRDQRLPKELADVLDDKTFEYTKEQRRQAEEEKKSRENKEAMLEKLIQQNEELIEKLAKIEALLGMNKDEQAKE